MKLQNTCVSKFQAECQSTSFSIRKPTLTAGERPSTNHVVTEKCSGLIDPGQ